GFLEQRRVGMFGRGDDYGVEILELQELVWDEQGARRGAVGFRVERDGAFARDGQEIADRGHVDIFGLAELRAHAIKFGPAAADTDVADGDAIVCTGDTAVGERAGADRSG